MKFNIDDDIDLIWENLNKRLYQKFGYAEEISKSVSFDDLKWARTILPAYIHWDRMNSNYSLLEFWQRKISNHLKKLSKKSNEADKASEIVEANKKNEINANKVDEENEAIANEIDKVEEAAAGEIDEVDSNDKKETGKY